MPHGENLIAEPARLGELAVRNRVVMPAMLMNFAAEGGYVSERLVEFLVERGRGGAGLLITEACYVKFKGGISTRGIAAYDERFLPGLSELASRVKETGAAVGVQLFFDGAGRGFATADTTSVGPSDLAPYGGIAMRPLSGDEIVEMRDAFVSAADLAFAAGFDCVEVHMGHGHFLGRFLSPYFNRREDEWGGDFERRLRLPREVVEEIRASHPTKPILIRLSLDEKLPGGIDPPLAAEIVAALEGAGITAVHTSFGTGVTPTGLAAIFPGGLVEDAPYVDAIRRLSDRVAVPIVAGGAIRSWKDASAVLDAGATFVSVGRALLADPYLPDKWARGDDAAVRPCVGCNEQCSDHLVSRREIGCSVNPWVGFEGRRPRRRALNVFVAGGGVAGLNAAVAAAERGHRVTVVEASSECGGRLRLLAELPGQERYGAYLAWLLDKVRRLDITLELGVGELTSAPPGFDVVIAAVGGDLTVDASRRGFSTACVPFNAGSAAAATGKRCLVVGRPAWVETAALQLAREGCDVIGVVTEGETPLATLSPLRRQALGRLGVSQLEAATIEEIEAGRIRVTASGVLHAYDDVELIVDVGSSAPRVFDTGSVRVGDCLGTSTVADAVRAASFVGASLGSSSHVPHSSRRAHVHT